MESLGTATRRLDSWKEIAAYFGKDVRTVRRWELQRGLPVHRVPGGGRASVFAYPPELEGWLARRLDGLDESPTLSSIDPDPEQTEALGHSPAAAEETSPALLFPGAAPRPFRSQSFPLPGAALRPSRSWAVLSLAAVTVVLFGVVLVAHSPSKQRQPEAASVARSQTNPRARDLYLRARFLWNLRTEKSLHEAVVLYNAAIAEDPHYAAAYAGLADSYLLLRQYGTMTDADAYSRAYFASRQALQADPSSLEAHRAYAFVLNFWMWNFPAAEAEFQRAIALDPRDAQSHHWYATSLLSAGRYQDASREIEIARQLQPDSVAILANRGFILSRSDPARALAALSEVEQANPGLSSVHRYIALMSLDAGQYDVFLREFGTYFSLLHLSAEAEAIERARVDLARHGSAVMLERLGSSLGALAQEPNNPGAMNAAMIYARLQDVPRTLTYLRLSCSRRESNFAVLKTEPQYAFLRGNPEFEDLVARSRTPAAAPPVPAEVLSSLASR